MSESPLFDAILTADVSDEQSKLSAEAAGMVWSELRNTSVINFTKQGFIDDLRPHEDRFMDERYGHLEESKKKDGSYKYRKFKYVDKHGNPCVGGLPPAWSSAKSVLNRAWDENVNFIAGESKSSVEKRVKEKAAANKPVDSAYTQCAKTLDVLLTKYHVELTITEQESFRGLIQSTSLGDKS